MRAFDTDLLDDPDRLSGGDHADLLRSLAAAGAQIRRAQEVVDEYGVDKLRGSDPPRALLVAPDAHAPYLSSLIQALGSEQAPVIDYRAPVLPKWAGPADAMLVLSSDGRHPRLAELVAQADRRGLALAVAAPKGSPVGVAAGRHPVADISHLAPVAPRARWWALAAPALQAVDALGLASVTHLFNQIADALDEVAETNRPDSSVYTGPAKLLAADLAESVPVIAGAGPGATAAARRVAGAIQLIGGSTAMAASLPDDVARIGSLLEFSAPSETDFFADRVEEATVRPRLVLIGDDDPFPSGESFREGDSKWDSLGEDAGRRAGAALAGLATSNGIGVSRIEVPVAPMLVRFAAAAALGDFAAAYLALARGIDPSAPRLGELPH